MVKEKRIMIVLKCLSFVLKIYGKSILNTAKNTHLIFNFKLKKILLDKYSNKRIAFINKLANTISMKLLLEHILEDYKQFYEEEINVINKEISEVLSNSEFKELIGQYFRLVAFYHDAAFIIPEKTESTIYLEKAQAYIENVPALSRKDLWSISKESRKSLRKEKRDYIRKLRVFLKEEAYKGIPKIEFSSEQATYFVGLVTVLFFLTGFTYNKYFLTFYGIDVSHFFSISDYFSTSINKIYIIAIGATLGVFFYLRGVYKSYRDEIIDIHFDVTTRKKSYFEYFFFLGILAVSIMAFYRNSPGKYNMLSVLIFLTLMAIFHKLPIERFFKKSLYIYVFGTVSMYFVAMMFGAIMDERDRIERLDITELKKYNIIFKEDVNLDADTCILLSNNSQYFFLYDKKLRKTYVVPASKVKHIETITKEK